MKIINVLSDNEDIANYAVAPLVFNKKKLYSLGYDVRIKNNINNSLFECNVLCLISKPTIRILKEKSRIFNAEGSVVQFLLSNREKVDSLVWMDDSDSTSVTHFEVLPYVDKYLKKQLFKDKELYRQEFYGGRIFSDYYHKNFNINDDVIFQQNYLLDKKHEHKVGLSWNIGLGNIFNSFTWKSIVKRIFPIFYNKPNYKNLFIKPNNKRKIDLFIRTSANLSRASVAFHRQELLRRLIEYQNNTRITSLVGSNAIDDYKEVNKLFNSSGKRMSTRKIRKIMSSTKVMPSPFGWGELGVRDYEAFKYGSLLLKPDMSHMETWPNIFIADKTYVPLKWGFSDLKVKLDKVFEDEKYRIQIANAGQKAFQRSISEKGMNEFCDWFIKQIETPVNEN